MLFVQLVIDGLQTGALYALAAAGFALIFGATRVFHIAHGITFALAGYVFLETYRAGWDWPISTAFSLIAAVVFALAIEWAVYRPILQREGTFFTLFVASFGIALAGQSAIELIFGQEFVSLSTPLARALEILPNLYVAPVFWIGLAVAAGLFISLILFLERTNVGIALRALSANPELLRAFGLSSSGISALAFALGSALCVPGAILICSTSGLYPSIGTHIVLVSMAATIVGGVGSLAGAALAGLVLGIAETLAVAFVANQWSEAVSFVALFACILIRPSGLFGAVAHK